MDGYATIPHPGARGCKRAQSYTFQPAPRLQTLEPNPNHRNSFHSSENLAKGPGPPPPPKPKKCVTFQPANTSPHKLDKWFTHPRPVRILGASNVQNRGQYGPLTENPYGNGNGFYSSHNGGPHSNSEGEQDTLSDSGEEDSQCKDTVV